MSNETPFDTALFLLRVPVRSRLAIRANLCYHIFWKMCFSGRLHPVREFTRIS